MQADVYKFADYAKHYYGYNETFKSYSSFPTKLLYPVDPPASLNTSSVSIALEGRANADLSNE